MNKFSLRQTQGGLLSSLLSGKPLLGLIHVPASHLHHFHAGGEMQKERNEVCYVGNAPEPSKGCRCIADQV